MNKEWSPVLHLIYRVLADRTTPPFTIHTSGSNHKPLKSVAHESSQTMAVLGNTSVVKICWAQDNENCGSAPAVTRTSCASN